MECGQESLCSKLHINVMHFHQAQEFNSDVSKWDVSRSKIAMYMCHRSTFLHSYKFNRNVSKWDVSRVTDFRDVFNGAKSFTFEPSVDALWSRRASSSYPGTNMFYGTCSIEASCGYCNKADTQGRSVICGSHQDPVTPNDTLPFLH